MNLMLESKFLDTLLSNLRRARRWIGVKCMDVLYRVDWTQFYVLQSCRTLSNWFCCYVLVRCL
jgi:hypothetical protein